MDVILLEKIGKLGDLGDKVTVKPGYGRNFLIPQGKAVPATKDNVEKFEARRAEPEAAAAVENRGANKDNWWDALPREEWTRLDRLPSLTVQPVQLANAAQPSQCPSG